MSRIRHRWACTWAALYWAFAMLLLWRAYRLALYAHQVAPEEPAPNCHTWAAWEFSKREKEWREAGAVQGEEPYINARYSRKWPPWVWHSLVGRRDSESGFMDLTSFKPTDPKDAESSIWGVLGRTKFEGRKESGD